MNRCLPMKFDANNIGTCSTTSFGNKTKAARRCEISEDKERPMEQSDTGLRPLTPVHSVHLMHSHTYGTCLYLQIQQQLQTSVDNLFSLWTAGCGRWLDGARATKENGWRNRMH